MTALVTAPAAASWAPPLRFDTHAACTAHRGAHLIDPRTGRAPSGIAFVTVIASSATWADIDATAAYVQGRDAGQWLQRRPIRSALVVWADGTTTRLATNPDRRPNT